MTAVNMQHVLTQGLEFIPVRVTKDILEMEKSVKVRKLKKKTLTHSHYIVTHIHSYLLFAPFKILISLNCHMQFA